MHLLNFTFQNTGPVCYRKNGFLSITDANLYLGRILPEHFPKIFGPNEDQPLDDVATRKAFEDLSKEINQYLQNNNLPTMTTDEIAYGFLTVANETMCRPIRHITEGKGYDASLHTLACFGGAGGQHACAIASSLRMRKVFIHRFG
jgi:5-oxoprolinase (ATP-hydrolysing)